MNVCGDCGAVQPKGAACLSCFHALLAYENERPPAFGAVHHLTVATYYLQHPRGYTSDVLRAWRDLLSDALDAGGRANPRDFLRRASRDFSGPIRVRDPEATPPEWWPRQWTMTIQSVITPDEVIEVEEYVARARQWAAETRGALERVWVP